MPLVQDLHGEEPCIAFRNLQAGVAYRAIPEEECPRLYALERRIYRAPWSYATFTQLFRTPGYLFLGAYALENLIGYGCGMVFSDRFELHNLAVAPEFRGQGIGRSLFLLLSRRAFHRGARTIWLESRASNFPAMELYRSFGLKPVGIRARYYRFPQEDAILWSGELKELPWNELHAREEESFGR